MSRNKSAITARSRAGTLFAMFAASAVLAQESGDERWATVKSWVGTLVVSETASGTVPSLNGSVTYTIDRHLNYPFTLESPGFPIGWWNCTTESSVATINDVFVAHDDRTGCDDTTRLVASGHLEPPPPQPNAPEGWPPCIGGGFQLQVIPFGALGVFTSWGFANNVKGQTLEHKHFQRDCSSLDTAFDTTFSFLPGDGSALCAGVGCLDVPSTGFKIEHRRSYDLLTSTYGAGQVNVHYDVHLDLVGCGEELDVVVNVIDYDEWRPMGGKTEDEEGNQVVIEARLQGKGGCPTGIKASRFIFEL